MMLQRANKFSRKNLTSANGLESTDYHLILFDHLLNDDKLLFFTFVTWVSPSS